MRILFTILAFIVLITSQAQQFPKKPNPPRLVNDYTNTLTPVQVNALENKLVAYDDSTSSQIAIVMISSLEGYDVADYAIQLARDWKIGGEEFSNGILILVAKDDHKMRIEVGYGLEGAVPDITAKSIIDNSLTPNFREDNYYRGLDRATDDIIKAAAGEYKAPANYNSKKKGTSFGRILGFIIFIVIMLAAVGGGRGRGGGTMSGAGWILGSILSSAGRSSGGWSGGGGGGGGGFGGFGGGGFGGGGASGSW